MYYYLSFLTKVFQKFGTREPFDSAIVMVSAVEGFFLLFLAGIVKITTGFLIKKIVVMFMSLILLVGNFYFFKSKRWKIFRKYPIKEISWFQAIVGVITMFAGTIGFLLLLIPISNILQ